MYKENHHNTVGYQGERKKKAEKKAIGQMHLIYDYMSQYPGRLFTPFDIQKLVLPNALITSVRRSLTNLTNKKHIVKTEEKRLEVYGEDNHTWMYPLSYECKECKRSLHVGKQCPCSVKKQEVVQTKLF